MKNTIIFLSLAFIVGLVGCSSNEAVETSTPTNSPESTEQTVVETEAPVDFDVDIAMTQWEIYHYEYLNSEGNLTSDGRGLDEWTQFVSFDDEGRVIWEQLDFEIYGVMDCLYGTYEIDGNYIIATADEDSGSMTQELRFEMIDGNELKLTYPETFFTYYRQLDESDWTDEYVTAAFLADTVWYANHQRDCYDECVIIGLDTSYHSEVVTFFADGTAVWQVYNAQEEEISDEIDGYWWIDGAAVVVAKYENLEENGIFDIQYFTYGEGRLYRATGGNEYVLELVSVIDDTEAKG